MIEIPMLFIDEPEHAMRSNVWDEDIVALANSIEQFGLLQPITVRRHGQRYEIIAGHRRYMAHKHLDRETIQGIVRDADDISTEAMKVHENLYRADVNPVDQAQFLFDYQERCKLSLDELADQLNRSVDWVKARLDILQFPDYLKAYVHEGRLSMSAAAELMRIKNPLLKERYAAYAAQTGLSARRAAYWVDQANKNDGLQGEVVDMEPPEDGDGTVERRLYFRCALDGIEYPAEDMAMVYVLPANLEAVRQAVAEAERVTE